MKNEHICDSILQFAAYLTSKGRQNSTIKRYAYDLEDCFHYLEEKKKITSHAIWDTFTTDDYRSYFSVLANERHYSDKTLHRILVVLNQFFTFLRQQNVAITNPIHTLSITIRPDRNFTDDDFITSTEEKELIATMHSFNGLSEKQIEPRKLLLHRNLSIVYLMLYYGVTLKELVSIEMKDVHLENNTISIPAASGKARTITLLDTHKKTLYTYIKKIPEAVRPKYHSTNPLFIAFDFNRGTYRWVYENDAPKGLTEISVQKMIRLEVKRANLRKGICAQHFRNTFILHLLEQSYSEKEIMAKAGFKTKISLRRFLHYANKEKV
ncbi:tyrosine-type recombinase/integrase [Priestia taiwanensis]|uniref:tyrosine-type recombinase/integrase n=1 Tax=Priestia taiwanensis TaxID=1347902 RepID=UPI003571078D